jgi:hypothetical protein
MKTDFDELPSWMQGHGFSWDEIIAELKAENPIAPSSTHYIKSGCKPRTLPQQTFPMESCGTIVFL